MKRILSLRRPPLFFIVVLVVVPFLGIPVGANHRRKVAGNIILERFCIQLSSPRGRNISLGDRIVLLNYVFNSLTIHFFSLFKAPKVVSNGIIKLLRTFLWGGKEGRRKLSWMLWDKVCLEKSKRELGVKYCEVFNSVLLVKCHWRILNEKEVIWQYLISFKYEDIKGIINEGFHSSVGSIESLWWKDLKKIGCVQDEVTYVLKGGFKGKFGNNGVLGFWRSYWLGSENFSE